ncbi:hypothetical protein C8R43DRAFT_955518 [Mycena crocata]|nr:hypothetical protein C8R43DRAFT_955518 [Mycena crocata]
MFDAHTKQQQHPPLALIPPPSPPTFSLPFPSAAILELPYPPGPYLNLSMAFLARFNNGARHFDNLKMVLYALRTLSRSAEALGSIQALACLRRAQCRECRRRIVPPRKFSSCHVPATGLKDTSLHTHLAIPVVAAEARSADAPINFNCSMSQTYTAAPNFRWIYLGLHRAPDAFKVQYFHTSPRVGRRVAPPSKFNHIFGVPGNSAHQCAALETLIRVFAFPRTANNVTRRSLSASISNLGPSGA